MDSNGRKGKPRADQSGIVYKQSIKISRKNEKWAYPFSSIAYPAIIIIEKVLWKQVLSSSRSYYSIGPHFHNC